MRIADRGPAVPELGPFENVDGGLHLARLQAGLLGDPDDRDPGPFRARIDPDLDRLGLPADPVLEPDRERVVTVHHGAAPLQEEAGAPLRTRHQGPFSPVEHEDAHAGSFLPPEGAVITPLTGPCDGGLGPALSSRRLRPGVPPPPVSDVSRRVSAAGASRGRGWRSTPTSVLDLIVTERRQTPPTLVNRELSSFRHKLPLSRGRS